MIYNLLYVAAGGSLGAVSRYSVALLFQQIVSYNSFAGPIATLAVNLAGCFFIGLTYPFVENHMQAEHRLFLVTGFLGSFTTFSTFALDTVTLSETLHALLYLTLSIVGGFTLAIAGIFISKSFISN